MIATYDAFAGVLLDAFGTGILAAAGLALLVALFNRVARPSATTQHALWWIVLVVTVLLPLTCAAASFTRIEHRTAHAMTAPPPRVPAPVMPPQAAAPARAAAAEPAAPAAAAPSAARWIAALALAIRTAAGRPGFATAAIALWLAVAALRLALLGYGLVALMRVKAEAVELDENVGRRLRRYRRSIRTGRPARLLVSADLDVPVAVGFCKPAILLPLLVAGNESAADLDQIVMHEHAHLNRYDDVTNFAGCTIAALFWFNPVVAIVSRQISLQREIACDDSVVAQTGRAHRYATCLWRLVESARLPARRIVAPGVLFTPKQITRRIEQLLDSNRNALPRLSPLSAFGFAAVSAVLIFAQASRAPVIAIEDPAVAAAAPLAVPIPVATPSPVAKQPEGARARSVSLRIASGATPEAIASAVIEATMQRSLQQAQRAAKLQAAQVAKLHSVQEAQPYSNAPAAHIAKAAAALGTGVGLDIARKLSERLAPASEWPAIERSISHADDMAQREIADDDVTLKGNHRNLAAFHRVEVDGSFDVEIRRGAQPSVDFQNDDYRAEHTRTEVDDGTLTLAQSNGSDDDRNAKRIIVYVPVLDDVEIDGSANVYVRNTTCSRFTAHVSGSGNLVASGEAGTADITLEGSGDADLLGLRSTTMRVATEGSGNVKLVAPTTLSVRIEGSGDVSILGTPKHVSSEIDGSGSIRRL